VLRVGEGEKGEKERARKGERKEKLCPFPHPSAIFFAGAN
jgi:hypothetical protein